MSAVLPSEGEANILPAEIGSVDFGEPLDQRALALQLLAAQDFTGALNAYKRHLQLRPRDTSAKLEFAELLDLAGLSRQAAEIYFEICSEDPSQLTALMGWLDIRSRRDPGLVVELLLSLADVLPDALSQLALSMRGLTEALLAPELRAKFIQRMLAVPHQPDRAAWELRQHLILPLFASSAELETSLERLGAALTALEAALPAGAQIAPDFGNFKVYADAWTPFRLLPALNVDALPWRRRWGALFRRLLPAVRIPDFGGDCADSPRIGFVLEPGTSASEWVLLPLLRAWPADCGTPVLFITAGDTPPEFEPASALEVYPLPAEIPAALARIASSRLDLLYYSDPLSEAQLPLAAYRLAPVQATGWQAGGASGLPNLDAFVSCQWMEPETLAGTEVRVAGPEQTIRLARIPGQLARRALNGPVPPRTDYGLPAGHLYVCPHWLYKLSADFDAVFEAILTADPQAQLVLLSRPDLDLARNRVLARFEARFPRLMPRIWFLPALSQADYLGLLALADVVLEPFAGAGLSALTPLGLGVPVVTLPGERLDSRITYAFYRKMACLDCVAQHAQDYVQIALGLAQRPDFSAEVRRQLLAGADALFADSADGRALAECLVQLAQAARAKERS